MRSKRSAHEIPDAPGDPVKPQAKERIRDGLEERGLPSDASERMSSQLEEHAETAPAELDAMLDGVVAAFGAEDSAREELTRNLAELKEIERLMESFVGELSKLDESLEVLSAFLRRMRNNTGGPGRRVLH